MGVSGPMKIPPQLPAPHFRKVEDQAGQKVMRAIHSGGNVNAFAAALCLLAMSWFLPISSLQAIFWLQMIWTLFFLFCAVSYASRAYEFFVEDYNARTTLAFANDESQTISGADSVIAGLPELAQASMLNNPNERIIGTLDDEPVFAPPGTTFVKYVGMQGSQKTISFVASNILHILNTQAHITEDHDHEEIEIESGDETDWEELADSEELASFDFSQTMKLDEYALEGGIFNDR